jgi:septal ring factor EnvC (AmiA/AmiB activator)
MFKKVSNIDLKNQIDNLDNKLDIVITKISSPQFSGCCDCQARETKIYQELKEFLEDKLTEVENKIQQQQDNIPELFGSYKSDMLQSLDLIISQIGKLTESKEGSINKIYHLLQDNTALINRTGTNLTENCKVTNEVKLSVSLLHYENELIKHQLLLEEELRATEQQIASLQGKIEDTLSNLFTLMSHLQSLIDRQK